MNGLGVLGDNRTRGRRYAIRRGAMWWSQAGWRNQPCNATTFEDEERAGYQLDMLHAHTLAGLPARAEVVPLP